MPTVNPRKADKSARNAAPVAKQAKRQPARTRGNILAAATAEFAAHGLAGARVDEIAARAGANKRMIYQYFGNKEALWLTVLERVYATMREEERTLTVADMKPVDGMRWLMEFNIRFCGTHPEFIALLAGENLNRAKYLRRSASVPKLYSPLLAMIDDLLRRGEREGVFRKGVDAVDLYITIASLGYFYYSNIHTLSAIFDRDLSAPVARAARERHVVDVLLGYLRPA